MDKFAVKVTKNSETFGHLPREYLRISWYFLARGRMIRVQVTGCRNHVANNFAEEWREILCRLVFSCSSKVKLNRLKELLENKIRR